MKPEFHVVEIRLSAIRGLAADANVVTVDGVPIRNLTNITIDATVGDGTRVSIEFFAHVRGIVIGAEEITFGDTAEA